MESNELTSWRVFERRFICESCKKDCESCRCEPSDQMWADENLEHWIVEPHGIVIERVNADNEVAGETIVNAEVVVNVERKYVHHSLTGFEFGYGESGPADLALNILGAFLPPPEAWRFHQAFKQSFITVLDQKVHRHEISGGVIKVWVEAAWRGE